MLILFGGKTARYAVNIVWCINFFLYMQGISLDIDKVKEIII